MEKSRPTLTMERWRQRAWSTVLPITALSGQASWQIRQPSGQGLPSRGWSGSSSAAVSTA